MTDKDNITLPREVVQDVLDALEGADDLSPNGTPLYTQEIEALRTHLAAPKQEPMAWRYKGEPWFDGNRWHDKFCFTDSENLAKFKDKNAHPLYAAPSEDIEALRRENERLTKANDELAKLNVANLIEIGRLRDDQQKVLEWVDVIKTSYREEQQAQKTRRDAEENIKKICQQSLG